jgi:transcription elongation factor GreA
LEKPDTDKKRFLRKGRALSSTLFYLNGKSGEEMNNELTKKDIEDMEAEIVHRKVVVRKELLEHVKEARAQGDLSENFEYYAAKKAKNQNESRIRFLERMIKTARVIDDDAKEDEVGMNKTVTLRVEEDGTLETYKIVTTMRKNSLKGLISIESPLGKQLLGHKVGDRVTIKVSDSYSYEVTITQIENTGLSEEDKIRDF